ncbi:MAG: TIGR02996 domain-containing protein [Nannocystaceae bacterium]
MSEAPRDPRGPGALAASDELRSRFVASDELRPYFAAILAAPEDDAPRLALAELLTARGDPRGESIRLACELEGLAPDDPARAALEARCAALPSFYFFTGAAPGFPRSVARRRGFVAALSCSAADFVAHAEVLLGDAPIRDYEANPCHGQGALLATCAALARLRRLALPGAGEADRAAVLASPHLAGLRELMVAAQLDGPAAVERLAGETGGLTGLRALAIRGMIAAPACVPLASLAAARGLERLDVAGAFVPDVGLATLRERLGEARVWPRSIPRWSYRFGVLDLSAGRLDAGEVRALLDRGEHRDAVTLVLSGCRVGDDGVARLARSGAFPGLCALQLAGTGLTDVGARALARESVGLERLERLDLGDVPGDGGSSGALDRSGVSDGLVRELARSPRLPALRTISRTREHRRSAEGREGREVVAIARDDGRVVESIVLHSLWP